jgi:hypothetical protein
VRLQHTLYRLFPFLLKAAVIFKPETLGWHRSAFRLYWRWKSRRRSIGRPESRPTSAIRSG